MTTIGRMEGKCILLRATTNSALEQEHCWTVAWKSSEEEKEPVKHGSGPHSLRSTDFVPPPSLPLAAAHHRWSFLCLFRLCKKGDIGEKGAGERERTKRLRRARIGGRKRRKDPSSPPPSLLMPSSLILAPQSIAAGWAGCPAINQESDRDMGTWISLRAAAWVSFSGLFGAFFLCKYLGK